MNATVNILPLDAINPIQTGDLPRRSADQKTKKVRKASSKPKPRLFRETMHGRFVPVRPRSASAPLAPEHRAFWIRNQRVLTGLGRETLGANWRNAFRHSGCIATMIAAIEAGNNSRYDILAAVKASHSCTYEHVGYLLGQMCGPDHEQHLWYKDAEGLYRLHDGLAAADANLAV